MYQVPTLTETEDFLAAMFKAQFPDRNVGSKRSYHRRRLKVWAAALTELHAHIDSARDDVMPDTATIAAGTLARWANIFGVDRNGATGARKAAALRIVGDAAATVTNGETLTHLESGLQFEVTEDVVIPAAGYFDADVAAVSTGAQTRLEAGEVLSFDATPAGVETRAELQLDLDEDGYDQEPEGAFKRRVLDVIAEPQAGGNDSDHVRWALEVDGIVQAYPYSNRAGIGSVDVVGLHVGTGTRGLTADERSELLAYLQEKEPSQLAGDGGALRVLETVEDEQDVEVLIEIDGDFDWDDATPPVILSINSATRTITFTAARPASMLAGGRICIHGVASAQDGDFLTIESLSSTDAIVVETWPDVDPAATDLVYAGSDESEIVRTAILAHMNGETLYADDGEPVAESVADEEGRTVKLNELASGIGPANPAGLYGDWSGSIILAVLTKIATYTRGVRNATVSVPASDYDAEDFDFPDDDQIGLIVPGEVLVRGA